MKGSLRHEFFFGGAAVCVAKRTADGQNACVGSLWGSETVVLWRFICRYEKKCVTLHPNWLEFSG